MTLSVFIFYFAAMLLIGYVAWSKTSSLSDFILGGRSLGPIPAALSAGASDMSGWLLLGLPGYAYAAGLEAVWIALGLFLGTWANWQFMAKPLRETSESFNNSLTIPDYLANRYPKLGRTLRLCSAMLILLFFLFYTSSGLVAAGKLFVSVLDIPYTLAVSVGLVAVVAYTLFGGFLAVTWTDVIQSLLMIVALVAVPYLAFQDVSYQHIVTAVQNKNSDLLNAFTSNSGENLSAIAIISLLAWGLGYFGQPHILARFMALKSASDAKRSRTIAVSWSFATLVAALCVGWVGLGILPTYEGDPEKIFIELIYIATHPLVAGILLAAILAAIMSTADSQLLVASSALSNDVYSLVSKNADPNTLIWVGRAAVLVVAVGAYVLALNPESSVLGLVSYAWAGFGAAFGPVLLLSLFWQRLSAHGALAGIVAGAATVIIWKNLSGGLFDIYEIVPGFLLSLASAVAISYIKPHKA